MRKRQRTKFLEVLLDVGDAGAGPIRAEQRLLRDLFQAREIFQQRLRRDAADVEINIGMSPHEKERRVHPERAAAVGQQNFQLGKIHRNIVDINRIAILVAAPGKIDVPV